MIFERTIRSMVSKRNRLDGFSSAPLKLVDPRPTPGIGESLTPGVAEFPRQPVAFLWHYARRRPILHATAVASVLGAAAFACFAQFGLKLIVDAMAAGPGHLATVWWALGIFAGLLAGESALWRIGTWLGFRAILVDKAE